MCLSNAPLKEIITNEMTSIMKLSDRINSVEESQTVQYTRLLQQLRNQGREVINLAVGEPHLNTPAGVVESTKRALDDAHPHDRDDWRAGNLCISSGPNGRSSRCTGATPRRQSRADA